LQYTLHTEQQDKYNKQIAACSSPYGAGFICFLKNSIQLCASTHAKKTMLIIEACGEKLNTYGGYDMGAA